MYNKVQEIDVTVEYVICRNDPDKLLRFHMFNLARVMFSGPDLKPIKVDNFQTAIILGFEDYEQ